MATLESWFEAADALLAELDRADDRSRKEAASRCRYHDGCCHGRKPRSTK